MVCLLLSISLTSCLDFSISEDELANEFFGRNLVPVIEEIQIGERTIGFVSIDQQKEVLLVFVHGSPGSWSAFMDYFKNDSLLESMDMLAIDRPGFGYSGRGWPEPSMAKQAYYLERVVSRFNHPIKLLIGHSLGGPVIARLAMDYPDISQGLIHIAPSIDPELEKYEWYRTWMKTRLIGALTPPDFWVSNEEILPLKDELTEMLPLWSKIRIPNMIIQGKNDVLVPWQNAEFARNMLPDSLIEIRYLEGVNHFIPWTNPKEVVQGILDLSNAVKENPDR